jgi:hypothetical protein
MTEKDECFVISPIGESGSDTRKRSDKVLEYVIEDAIDEYGYRPVRADEISEPGIITTQIIERVLDSPLVIADLTDHNANVFYELAVRHAARRPVIQLIDSEQEIPFDIANTRTVHFTLSDVETYENAKEEIQNQIESIEDSNDVENPVSVGVDLQLWRESGDPQQEEMADVVERITELQGSIRSVERLIKKKNNHSPDMNYIVSKAAREMSEIENEFSHLGDQMWDVMSEEDKDQFKKVNDITTNLNKRIDKLEKTHGREQVSLSDASWDQ